MIDYVRAATHRLIILLLSVTHNHMFVSCSANGGVHSSASCVKTPSHIPCGPTPQSRLGHDEAHNWGLAINVMSPHFHHFVTGMLVVTAPTPTTSQVPNYVLQIRALPLAIPGIVISMFLHVAGMNDT